MKNVLIDLGVKMSNRLRKYLAVSFLVLSPLVLAQDNSEYSINIEARESDSKEVEISVTTNIPGTIEVFGAVSLSGQKGDDVYIGVKEKFFIKDGVGFVALDVNGIPSGDYDAEVNFYPRWGFKDDESRATGISENVRSSIPLKLEGSGESAELASQREEGQRWVMENAYSGVSWSPGYWIERFGFWKQIPTQSRNPEIIKNYYFESIDMTVIVNVLKSEIVTWRTGKDGL